MTLFADTYDTATPPGGGDPTEADDRMRETKAAVQQRMDVDHYWEKTGTEVSDPDTGEHRKVTLRTGSAPAAVADKGIIYAKDVGVGSKAELFYRDEDGNEVQITTGGIIKLTSAALLAILANDTYFTGVDNAGTGTVNLIKAGDNDLATLPDGAEMASDAAPGEDEGIANRKYVDEAPKAQAKVDNVAGATFGAGSESSTLPNGFIIKMGNVRPNGNSTIEVIYGFAFPTAALFTFASFHEISTAISSPAMASPKAGSNATILQITNAHNDARDIDWFAIGH